MISEELINTIKWVLPGIILFDSCRTRKQVVQALVCLLVMYLLLSAQVVKRMPWESARGGNDAGIQHTRLKVCQDIGYSSCDMSTILAGASWGMLAALPLVRKKKYSLMILAAAGVIAFGQALTGGRAGYVAWGATGLVLCLLKWRKQLLLAPVLLILLPILLPGAAERMMYGFGKTDASGQETVDDYEMTSGRTLIWPYVIEKIGESPAIGYGRLAMNRTGLSDMLMSDMGEAFPHPHNMYFETLLDNGIVGSIPILLFWGMMVLYSARLCSKQKSPVCGGRRVDPGVDAGSIGCGTGRPTLLSEGEHNVPVDGHVLVLRVYVEETRVRMDQPNVVDQVSVPAFVPEPIESPAGVQI